MIMFSVVDYFMRSVSATSMSLFIVSLVMSLLCMNDVVYEITESWKSNSSGEPSGMYKISIRIGGIACSLVGIAGITINFVL